MDATTQRFLGLIFWLAINSILIGAVGAVLWGALRRRMAVLRADFTTEHAHMDERVKALERGQEAMRLEQVAQRELLHRISVRLGRQTALLQEIKTGTDIADTVEQRLVTVLLPRLLSSHPPGTTWHVGEVRGERDAHLGSTINKREGD